MKVLFTTFCLFLAIQAGAQVFNGTGGAILNTGNETSFGLGVSGLSPATIDSMFGIEELSVDISHATVEELRISLKSPSGIIVELADGCIGTNYAGTTFKNGNGTSITVAPAPRTGVFRPLGNMGRFNTGQPGNGTWTLLVKDWNNQGNAGTVNSWSIKFGTAPAKPVVFKSSNLPIVVINTNGQHISDVNDIVANFGVIYNGAARNNVTDAMNNYNGKANIHIRGSSSKNFEKKSFKVELCDNSGVVPIEVGLVGMPPESDWVLTACYSDKSLIRNPLVHQLFTQMSHYSPRTQMVEVILNNEYWGVYVLTEQPKKNDNRIDISKMTPLDNSFPYITGGYIIQINRSDDEGWYSLYPGISVLSPPAKFYYQYNYPRAEDITPQQKNYIKAVMDTFEMVMASPSFNDPKVGYSRYIDVESFIDFFLLNEFSKNADAYKLSTYLYKDNFIAGGKLHIGPMWDYDIAWHNCDYGNTSDAKYWQYEQTNNIEPIPTWWKKFATDPAFNDRLYCSWHTKRQTFLSNNAINSYIDQMAAYLQEAQQRNFRQFPVIGAYVFPNPQNQAAMTYQEELNDLKKWVADRGAWMDQHIPGFCTNVGVPQLTRENGPELYPNPFEGPLTMEYHNEDETLVKTELFDVLGHRVIDQEVRIAAGNHREELNVTTLVPGTYTLRITLNGKTYNKKIVKLH